MARVNGATDAAMSRPAWPLAIAVSIGTFALRFHLAGKVGFGDAEALYACYALHPQPAYLDHPGLVGVIARLIGNGGAPTPLTTHRFTALGATLIPWLGFLAACAAGARPAKALRTFFALALVPEMSIGLFALTPDLPLAALWLTAIGAAAFALRRPPGSRAALGAALLLGFSAGLAVNAKVSGLLLLVAIAGSFASRSGRAHLRTLAPWCGLVVVLVVTFPLVTWEWQEGWPLLGHRLVATQARSGFSLRNLGALLGGQLLYVTPPFLLGAWRVFRALQCRTNHPTERLLFLAAVVPGAALALLCLWSRVAEPHWVAPAYLALAIGASLVDGPNTTLDRVCFVTGVVAVIAGFVLVATPLLPQLSGPGYVPRYDLVNDLYAWRSALPLVEEELESAEAQSQRAVVVGPHWTVCAQIHAALGASIPVGCQTPTGDDFARWLPKAVWNRAPTVIFVTDDRFDAEPKTAFPDRDVVSVRSTHVFRGGRPVRTIRVARLDKRAVARSPEDPKTYSAAVAAWAVSPAARSKSESSSEAGFGVVSRRSP